MPIESASLIHELNASNPEAGDLASTADDHLRLIKSTVKATFPNVTAAVTATHTQLNSLTAVTPAEVAALAGAATTGAALKVTTQTVSDSSAAAASTAFTQALFASIAGSVAPAVWVSGTTYAAGDLVYSPVDFQTYRRTNDGAGTTDPSLSTDWERTSTDRIIYAARTSNTELNSAAAGRFIDITSGTFSQTFATCAGLGSGWWVILRNSGTGDITLDPASTEQIDGLTSFVMYPREARLIQCDGSALRSVVLQPFSKTYTTSGSFVKPPGYTQFAGLIWGGGGSGAKASGAAGGGGGGACHAFTVPASRLSATEDVVIGAGGDAVTSATVSGNVGGYSCIGPVLTPKVAAYGGAGGSTSAVGGVGGSVETGVDIAGFGGALQGNFSFYGGGGGGGTVLGAGSSGGKSVYGAGGGAGSGNAGQTYAGGASVFGGAGGASADSANGTAGTVPGGGGGGTRTGSSSGAGARGEVRIWGL